MLGAVGQRGAPGGRVLEAGVHVGHHAQPPQPVGDLGRVAAPQRVIAGPGSGDGVALGQLGQGGGGGIAERSPPVGGVVGDHAVPLLPGTAADRTDAFPSIARRLRVCDMCRSSVAEPWRRPPPCPPAPATRRPSRPPPEDPIGPPPLPPPHGARQGTRRFGDGVLALVTGAVTLPILWMGYGTDLDIEAVLATAGRIRDLDYLPSPNPGVPVVETIVALLDPVGGHVLVNLATAGALAATVVGIARLVQAWGTTTATWWRWRSWPRPSSSSPARRPPTSCGPPRSSCGGRWRCCATARCRPGCCSRSRSAAAARRCS